jgi:hypothetical protein
MKSGLYFSMCDVSPFTEVTGKRRARERKQLRRYHFPGAAAVHRDLAPPAANRG